MWIARHAPRDDQRIRVYRAQGETAAYLRDLLPTIQEAQNYVDAILESHWMQSRFGSSVLAPITVLPARGRDATAQYYLSTIALPKATKSKFIVIHEVCHIVTDRYYGEDCTAAHGPQFTTFLLGMVDYFLGADDCRDLLEAFRRYGVEHSFRGSES